MIHEDVAADARTMQGGQVLVEAAHNSEEVAGVLTHVRIFGGLALDRIGTRGDCESFAHGLHFQ